MENEKRHDFLHGLATNLLTFLSEYGDETLRPYAAQVIEAINEELKAGGCECGEDN